MRHTPFDPKARAKEQRAQRKKVAAEAKMLEEAFLRARNMEILMGIEEDDRVFWPGCSVTLRVGAIRHMRTIDSLVGNPGFQGDLVASASSFIFDIPNYADVAMKFDRRAHVEFIAGSSNHVLGIRMRPAGSWIFVVTLTAPDLARLGSFAAAVDPGDGPWFSPDATALVQSGTLAPLRIDGHETPDFVGLVDSLQFGTAEPGDG